MKNPCKSHLRGFFYCQKLTIFINEVDFRLIQVIYSFFFYSTSISTGVPPIKSWGFFIFPYRFIWFIFIINEYKRIIGGLL